MHKRNLYLNTVSLEEAQGLWASRLGELDLWGPMPAQPCLVREALGRVTAHSIVALVSSPFYHASAMDGYAVRFTDTIGATPARPRRLSIGHGAIMVDTGDPMPDGTDAVIMVEDVNIIGNEIEFGVTLSPWKNVRTVGEDIVESELICPENHKVRPVDIGAMLAAGHLEIPVRRRPRVAIIPTGSEIIEPGTVLKKGDIIESNSWMLSAMTQELGAQPIRMPIVPDDPARLTAALKEAASIADLVIVNAGASAGSEDYTRTCIKTLGEVFVHGINIKPGKPIMLGVINGKPVLGAPGYPVSTFLAFELFARPLLQRWLGQDSSEAQGMEATLSRQVASSLGQEEFLRMKVGKVGSAFVATPLGRGAGLMMSLVRADGFLRVPAMSEGIGAGQGVHIALSRLRQSIEDTVVSIGSHDNALDVLANVFKKRHPRYSLSSAHVGSMGGLVALARGEAHMAPTHLLDETTGEYNVSYIKKLLPGRDIVLMNLVHRVQGFMVPPGNPKGIKGVDDLMRPDVMFINRQRGAGTRLLLDTVLRQHGYDPRGIRGYDKEEYTHMAVASAVRTGVADTGLGVLSAARVMGLEFLPLANERYDLALDARYMQLDMMQALLEIIREDKEFRDAVISMGGYEIHDMGRVIGL